MVSAEYRENVNGGCEYGNDCDRDAEVYDHEAGTAFCVWHASMVEAEDE